MSCESKDCKGDVCGENKKACYPSLYKVGYNPGEGGKCSETQEVCFGSGNKAAECSKEGSFVKEFVIKDGVCKEFDSKTGVCSKVESDLSIDVVWEEGEVLQLKSLLNDIGLRSGGQLMALPTPTITSISPTSGSFLGGGSMTINVSNIIDKDTFTKISSGYGHTCGIKTDGWVYCWGYNNYGQLGNDSNTESTKPVAIRQGVVPSGVKFTAIGTGMYHTCAIGDNGKAYCWGLNTYGQLGNGSNTESTTPVAVSQGTTSYGGSISLGENFSCATGSRSSASVTGIYCWGQNDKGQLGNGSTTNSNTPVQVSLGTIPTTLTALTSLTTGNKHACVLDSGNMSGGTGPIIMASSVKAYCWGDDGNKQLGRGTPLGNGNYTTPVDVAQGAIPSGIDLESITAGNTYTCGLGSNLKIYCWGSNTYGELGNGTTTPSNAPVAVSQGAVPSGVTFRSVSAGSYHHACGIGSNYKAYCWGQGSFGKLGNGGTGNSSTPVAVSQGAVASDVSLNSVSTGQNHTCTLGNDSTGYCWGYNVYGQLGNSSNTQSTVPAQVTNINESEYSINIGNNSLIKMLSQGTTSITVDPIPAHVPGTFPVTIKRLSDNTTSNSRNFTYNNLPAPTISSIVPNSINQTGGETVNISGSNFLDYKVFDNFVSISLGNTHSCGIDSVGQGYCWGQGASGRLGNGGTSNSSIPVVVSQGAIPAGVTLSSISAGGSHTCAIGSNSKGYCWGYNYYGQLGNGSTTQATTPVAVSQGAMPAGVTLQSISTGFNHTCAIGSNGKGYCWGYNYYGQLGNGSTTQSTTPVAVSQGAIPAGVTLKSISAGDNHTCAIGSNDKGYCWGYNYYGQLGNGSTTQATTPVSVSQGAIPSGGTFLNISTGSSHTCATVESLSGMVLRKNVYCWGLNSNGQLGDGTTTQRTTPILVGSFSYVSTGYYHTCGIGSDGKGYCWGNNSNGQLGNGSTTQSTVPVQVSSGAIPSGIALRIFSAGNSHTCGIGSDGHGYCWGYNGNGRLGNMETTDRPAPSYILKKEIPTIEFGSTPATSTTYTSTTSMSAVTPALSTTGILAVKLTNPDGQYATYNITVQSAPTEPLNLTATAGNKQVTLNWTVPSSNGGASITDYVIQHSTNGSTWTTFDDGVSTSTSATVTGLTNGQQYYFRVAAVNSVGQGPYTSNVTATPVNQPPTFTSVSNNSPVNPGANITWSTVASDPDSSQVKLVVCKTQGVTGTACSGGASDTWCTSSLVASNPSCSYSVPSPFSAGTYNAYAYIFDGDNAAATGTTQGSNSFFNVNSVAPIVTSVSVNGGQSITPEESTTVGVDITATVTSDNSCQSISDVKAYLYRSGVGYSNCSSSSNADNNKCYTEISCSVNTGTCTGPTDKTASYTCTASVWYYADPTDTQTQYDSQNWLATVKATVGTVSGTAQSSGVEMNSLVAFSVTETLNYGTLIVNQTTDPLDKIVVTTATGNVGLNQNHSGENMGMCVDYPTCTVGTPIGLSHQKYSTSQGSSYTDSSVSKPLTDTPTLVELRVPKVTSIPISRNTWWGVSIPINTRPGAYEGRNRIEAVKSASTYWPE